MEREMTPERRHELEEGDSSLTPDEQLQGYHFCPDWDFMLVGPEDPEQEGCTCSKIPI